MKEWFKHEFGYVNIDAKTLYFNNTGNWSDTKPLKEKGLQKSNNSRKSSIQSFIIICSLLAISLVYKGFANGKLLIGIPILVYLAYNYLKSEIGPRYKLPISKISAIDIDNNTVTIHFTDALNKQKTETLVHVDCKGINLLKALQ